MDGDTFYDILGIGPTATAGDIRSAYRRVSGRVHPDAGGTGALFRQVHDAYVTLVDPRSWECYDARLRSHDCGGRAGPAYDDAGRGHPEGDRPHGPEGDRPHGRGVPATEIRASWTGRHPSPVVAASGVLMTWVGLEVLDGLAALGLLVVWTGVVGMIGSARARADESARWGDGDVGPVRRFGADLRFGLPRVCRFVLIVVAVWLLRAEFRRATGGWRR